MAKIQSSASRRQFLADSAQLACGVGMLGLGLGLYAKQSKALPALALRPLERRCACCCSSV